MFFFNKEKLTGMALTFLLVLTSASIYAQQNNNWILINSGAQLKWGSSGLTVDSVFDDYPYNWDKTNTSAISNFNEKLLFYIGANTIWNKDFHVMEGAPDTINASSYFFSLNSQSIILPVLNDTTQYNAYIAQEASNSLYPPYSSLIKYEVAPWHINLWQPYDGKVLSTDTLFNGGGFYSSQTLNAVKHGNGRDWWILFHPMETDSFMVWRQEANGSLSGPFYQEIGPYHPQAGYDLMRIAFTQDGTRMALMMFFDIYLYDFDRCTGLLSNPMHIDSCSTCTTAWLNGNFLSTPYFSTVFSFDGNKLYVSRQDTLIQIDLIDFPNQVQREVIWYAPSGAFTPNSDIIGSMQIGEDRRIYVGTTNFGGVNVTYLDSGSMYLGIINSPNLSGQACNFNRYGLFLGGLDTDLSLTSYINYDLGPWVGSPCDTLTTTSLSELNPTPQITLSPNPTQTEATLTWSGIQEGSFMLRDMLGRAVLDEVLNAPSGTTRLDLSTLPKGIYLWQVQSDSFTKNGKLVVE
jgi:hypothetical protein